MSLHENISSLYDDELDASERDQAFTALKHNDDHKRTWERYSLIGDAMRNNLPDNPQHALMSRVQLALEDEPVLLAPSPENVANIDEQTANQNVVEFSSASANSNVNEKTQPAANDRFFKPVAGFAVAASVALASVLGFQMFSQSPMDNFAPPAIATAEPFTQELNIGPISSILLNTLPVTEQVAEVEFTAVVADGPVSEFDDEIYAQQSVMDDGQWTRITRIGNILLDNNIIYQTPEYGVNVDMQTGLVPFARAVNLDTVKAE